MKTLIFNGSPREKGSTKKLVSILAGYLKGECKIIDAYKSRISPCIDCRYCMNKKGCAAKDEMQEIYDYIHDCDNIVIASPVYFSGLTPPIVSIGSRLQRLYCGRMFRNEYFTQKLKKGAVILTRDGDGAPDIAIRTAKIFLKQMYCDSIYEAEVFCGENPDDAERLKEIAVYFNNMQKGR